MDSVHADPVAGIGDSGVLRHHDHGPSSKSSSIADTQGQKTKDQR
jgi:hypothetical protein